MVSLLMSSSTHCLQVFFGLLSTTSTSIALLSAWHLSLLMCLYNIHICLFRILNMPVQHIYLPLQKTQHGFYTMPLHLLVSYPIFPSHILHVSQNSAVTAPCPPLHPFLGWLFLSSIQHHWVHTCNLHFRYLPSLMVLFLLASKITNMLHLENFLSSC